MTTVSAVIITKDETSRIRRCLESVRWVDELIVVDSGSTDATVEICRQFGGKVVTRALDTFAAQKNFAVDRATGEWVLSLDADEVLSPELSEEIRGRITTDGGQCAGYVVRRENYLCGRPIRHAWGEDRHLRLFRRGNGKFIGSVHERVVVDGEVGRLVHPLVHYNSESFQEYLLKNELYTSLEAGVKYEKGERFSVVKLLFSPVRVFLFRFVALAGYRDGAMGLVLSMALAYFAFRVHVKMWRMEGRHEYGS